MNDFPNIQCRDSFIEHFDKVHADNFLKIICTPKVMLINSYQNSEYFVKINTRWESFIHKDPTVSLTDYSLIEGKRAIFLDRTIDTKTNIYAAEKNKVAIMHHYNFCDVEMYFYVPELGNKYTLTIDFYLHATSMYKFKTNGTPTIQGIEGIIPSLFLTVD